MFNMFKDSQIDYNAQAITFSEHLICHFYMRAFHVQRKVYAGFYTLDQIVNEIVNIQGSKTHHTSNETLEPPLYDCQPKTGKLYDA